MAHERASNARPYTLSGSLLGDEDAVAGLVRPSGRVSIGRGVQRRRRKQWWRRRDGRGVVRERISAATSSRARAAQRHGKTYSRAAVCRAVINLAAEQGGQYVRRTPAQQRASARSRTAVQAPTFCDDFGASNTTLKTACDERLQVVGQWHEAARPDLCTKDSDCAPSTQGDVTCVNDARSAERRRAQSPVGSKIHAEAGDTDARSSDQIGDRDDVQR